MRRTHVSPAGQDQRALLIRGDLVREDIVPGRNGEARPWS